MTKCKWLSAAILIGLFQIALIPTASAGEDFYWKNSYTRGVGTIPPSHACGSGKEEDAGLCYAPCKSGYHGIGPVCWQNSESYPRGAGTIPSLSGCKDGKEKDAGLCYTPCKAGYHGKGPVCWHDGSASYGRGAGTALQSVCESGKESDAGLCYTQCKADYNGIGPVCWGKTPAGYVDCGAGFAKDKKTCAETTASQVAAVAMFIGTTAAPEAKAAWAAKKAATGADELPKIEKVFEALKTLLPKFEGVFEKLKKGATNAGDLISDLKTVWKELPEADKLKLKLAVQTAKAAHSVANDQVNPIDLLRDAASIASIIDPSGLLSVASAYMYPVYGVEY